jgi:hypothetical protein
MLAGLDVGYCYYDAGTGTVGSMNAATASTQFQLFIPVKPESFTQFNYTPKTGL